MKFSIFTNYKDKVFAQDERGFTGEATLGRRDEFNLMHGAKVAVLRLYIAPVITPSSCGMPKYVGELKMDTNALIEALGYASFSLGSAIIQKPFEPGLWQALDYAAFNLRNSKMILKDTYCNDYSE